MLLLQTCDSYDLNSRTLYILCVYAMWLRRYLSVQAQTVGRGALTRKLQDLTVSRPRVPAKAMET